MNQTKRLVETHLGAKKKIEEYGLSVFRNDFSMTQAVDLAGEQTFVKSAKTASIYYFLYIFLILPSKHLLVSNFRFRR